MPISYQDFQRGLATGNFRLVPDENGNTTWYQSVPDGMGGSTMQAMPGFTPPSAPAPLPLDNLGAGLQTPLTSGGQPVYATNGVDMPQQYYLGSDPNKPADAAPAYAGGYSTDNGGGFLGNLMDQLKSFPGNTATLANQLAGNQAGIPGLDINMLKTGQPSPVTLGAALAGGAELASPGIFASAPAVAGDAATAVAPEALGAGAADVAGGLKIAPEAASLNSAISGASAAGGANGIIAGTPGPGLVVPGITGAGSTGAIGAAGLGMGAGALGADLVGGSAAGGATAAGTSGAAGAAGGAAGAAAAGAGGVGATKIGSILSGDVSPSDILSNATLGDAGRILGTGALTVGSILGQQQIADKYDALARDYMGLGAPSRARYEASFAPGFDIMNADPALRGAMDTASQSLLRGLSTQGNPYGNPGGLAEVQKYITGNIALPALQNYRNQNASTGGFGGFSTAAPGAASASIGAQGGMYSDIGRGLSSILNPPTPTDQLLKQMRSGGLLSLT